MSCGKKHKKTKQWTMEELDKLIETTLSGAIGGYPMPMAFDKDDPAMGGRKKFNKKQLRFAVRSLLKQ